jgi:putative DNA primase/helicase
VGQAVEGSARELLAENETDEGASEVDEAEQFLRELLAGGAMTSGEVKRESRDAGYAWATIRRAQKHLGIKPTKSGMKGKWFWSLNNQNHEDAHEDVEDAQQNSVSNFGKNEHLRENSSSIADAWEC